ncbi:MAG: phosphotransferase, partial [Longimicrobiales bacterium]
MGAAVTEAADGRGAAARTALTPPAAVRYLLERGLVHPRSIVGGELVATDAARRNRNVKVVSGDGESFLLKQGIGAGGIATVAHEAAVYGLLLHEPRGAVARRYLPRCFGYDAERGVLVLELFREAHDLRQYHVRRGRFPKHMAAALGRALADLHRIDPKGDAGDDATLRMRRPPPWALTLHRPRLEHLSEMSGANLNLVRIVQHAGQLCDALDELRRDWQTGTLIHGDVKWENCLI